MADLQEFDVRLSSGLTGKVLRTSRFLDKREFNIVKLSNGQELKVPSAALEPQEDGSFFLRDGQSHLTSQREESSVASGRDSAATEEKPSVDASLFKEEIDMQRVPVNRVLDAPAEIRIEDGVTIIPVMEERLKIEKQLILREEIRISKKRTSVRDPRLVSLAKDRVDINPRSDPEQ